MSTSPLKHVVAFPQEGWGHSRPLIPLSTRIVRASAVSITFLTTNKEFDKVKAEFAQYFDPGEEELASKINVVSLSEGGMHDWQTTIAQFKVFWTAVATGGSFTCAKTGQQYDSLGKPHAAIIDYFMSMAARALREISQRTVKLYTWYPGLAYVLLREFAPEKYGGKGNTHLKAAAESQKSGRPYAEVITELMFPVTDATFELPGMPVMHEWELLPQDLPVPMNLLGPLLGQVHPMLEDSDGLLLYTADSFEHQAIAPIKEWFAETGRGVYVCGPLLSKENEAGASKSADARTFLDKTLETKGEKSLVYVGLGSQFWPVKSPEKMWTVVDVLIELDIPFILSLASPAAVAPEELKEKVAAYGKGLLLKWAPQQVILDHPATGWFVSHGGTGGVFEAIIPGVPMIFWPFIGDQVYNSALLTERVGAGYELFEVRTGHGLKAVHRIGRAPTGTPDALRAEVREVLQKAFGEDGKARREKLQAVRTALLKEWEPEGTSAKDVQAFLENL